MKPVELVCQAVKNSSKSKDIVRDSFGGSGFTLIACEKLERYARLIELDPIYCDVIVKRWEEFTGKKYYSTQPGHLKTFISRRPTQPTSRNIAAQLTSE